MNRRRLVLPAAMLAAGLVIGGVVTASAQTANDAACRTLVKSGQSTQNNLLAYDACRFDKLDAAVAGLGATASAPSPSATPTPTPTRTPTPSPTPSPTTSTTPPAGATCTNPSVKFSGNGSQGIGNGYDVSLESWGVNGYNYAADLGECSHDSWYANITTDNSRGDGAVKSYPSMRKIYHDWSGTDFSKDPRLSSFPKLTVDFAQTDPASCAGCIYEDAFDIWANGIGGSNNTELMIWTSNVGQSPYGSKVASGIVVDGRTWDLYSGNSDHYIAYVPTDGKRISSGTVDIKAFFSDLINRGRIADNAYASKGSRTDPFIGQISYGVEPVSTNGVSRHWDFTKMTVNDK